jgi:hypothetical protein
MSDDPLLQNPKLGGQRLLNVSATISNYTVELNSIISKCPECRLYEG